MPVDQQAPPCHDRAMDPKVPWKTLSRRGAFSSKQVAFFAVAGLALVVGIFLRAGHYFRQPAEEEKAPVAVEASPPAAAVPPTIDAAKSVPKTPQAPKAPRAMQQATTEPSKPAEQAGDAAQQAKPEGDAVEQAEQPESKYSGVILVSKKPVEMLASPSASASVMYGFPAGRPFRVIGREGSFAHIQDLRSGASGWIDEAALTEPPPKQAVAPPSKPTARGASPKPKVTKKDAQVATDSEVPDESDSVQPRNRPRLFGKGGLFGGIFGGGN